MEGATDEGACFRTHVGVRWATKAVTAGRSASARTRSDERAIVKDDVSEKR